MIHDLWFIARFWISTTKFFVVMSRFTTGWKIKGNMSIDQSMDLWHLNNVKFITHKYASDYCLWKIFILCRYWSFFLYFSFRIVVNRPKWYTEFNFTSVSLYWIIISYELRYVVLRICAWENPCIENFLEAAFQECSLQWLLLQYEQNCWKIALKEYCYLELSQEWTPANFKDLSIPDHFFKM